MKVTKEMYVKLFGELTKIERDLQNIIERIHKVQQETEEIYINMPDEKAFLKPLIIDKK